MKKLTLNYHLTNECNYKCLYCYSHYNEIRKTLNIKEKKQIINNIAQSDMVRKINFAGGESLLDKDLPELIKLTKSLGLITSIISNASLFTKNFLFEIGAYLDIIRLSCDSGDNKVLQRLKSGDKDIVLKAFKLIDHYNKQRDNKIYKKLNTVITKINFDDNMNNFVAQCKVDRWKIFQVHKISGENDKYIDKLVISETEFKNFINNNKNKHNGIMISESSNLMEESYLMVNTVGDLYQNSNQRYELGPNIINNKINDALNEINFDYAKYIERKADYNP